jgi:CubicO group peptidase (beta-lactamase class C family)
VTSTASFALAPRARRRPAIAISLALALVVGISTSAEAATAGVRRTGSVSAADVKDSFATLDQIVKKDMSKTGVPGVAVAVVHGDEVVYTKGYGVRSTETGEKVTPETVFQIASLSKPVSSTIMAGLVGEGAFAWDDPVTPQNVDYPYADPWVTDHVTYADLFAHRSGLPGAAGNDLEAIGYDRSTILDRLRYVPLDPFRSTYSYSNFAMTLGGETGAAAAGSTWEDASERVLFDPVGMTSTSMRHDDFLARSNRADLHVEVDGEWVPDYTREPDAQAPAGGVSSNVVDLAQWMRLQLRGGMLGDERIIDEEALDATHTPHVMNRPLNPVTNPASFYGLGWSISVQPDGEVAWDHSGAFSNGAATTVKLIPAEDIGIVVLTNAAPIGVAEAIAADYLDAVISGSTKSSLALWTKRFSGLYGPKPDLTEPANPTPARDAAAYVGTYRNDYVGDMEIVDNAGTLQLVVGPGGMTYDLEHFDGDTFLYLSAPETPDYPSQLTFAVGADGVATALTDTTFEGSGQELLTRA